MHTTQTLASHKNAGQVRRSKKLTAKTMGTSSGAGTAQKRLTANAHGSSSQRGGAGGGGGRNAGICHVEGPRLPCRPAKNGIGISARLGPKMAVQDATNG